MIHEITICILSHGQLEYTKACILSFIKNNTIPYKLIVNSDMDDGTREWCATIPEIYKCLYFEEPFTGPATARNASIREATKIGNKFIIMSDNDNIVPFGYDKYIFDILEKDSKLGFLMPMSLDMNWLQIPNLSDKIQYIKHKKKFSQTHEDLENIVENAYAEYGGFNAYANKMITENLNRSLIDYMNTWSFFCCKLDVINKVGGYDENFIGAGWEDLDFARRINLAGYRTAICPQALIHHFMGTTRPHLSNAIERETRNQEYYAKKWNKKWDMKEDVEKYINSLNSIKTFILEK